MRIIYKNKDNSIGILIPTLEALSFATIEQIAEKDVPKDFPYWLVKDEDVPEDRTNRNIWEFKTDIEPNGFGGNSNKFDNKLLKKYKGIK